MTVKINEDGADLVEFSELGVLVLDGGSGSLVEGHHHEGGEDVEPDEVGPLVGAERRVHQKQVEVLRQVAAVVGHLLAEQRQHRLQQTVGQPPRLDDAGAVQRRRRRRRARRVRQRLPANRENKVNDEQMMNLCCWTK